MVDICQLCSAPGAITREHVFPQWFLKRWPDSEGPFTMYRDGRPSRNRSGEERRSDHLSRIFLGICVACHKALNDHFEVRAKEPVRALLDDGEVLRAQSDVDVVARWMIKTLALCRHPNSRHEGNLVRPIVPGSADFAPINPWDPFPAKLAEEITTGVAPTEVSLWMARTTTDPEVTDPPLLWEGWATRPPEHQSFIGFSTDSDELAVFQLAYHPGRSHLDHPFVATGQAVQLWPSPPESVSLETPDPVPMSTRMHSVFPR